MHLVVPNFSCFHSIVLEFNLNKQSCETQFKCANEEARDMRKARILNHMMDGHTNPMIYKLINPAFVCIHLIN